MRDPFAGCKCLCRMSECLSSLSSARATACPCACPYVAAAQRAGKVDQEEEHLTEPPRQAEMLWMWQSVILTFNHVPPAACARVSLQHQCWSGTIPDANMPAKEPEHTRCASPALWAKSAAPDRAGITAPSSHKDHSSHQPKYEASGSS